MVRFEKVLDGAVRFFDEEIAPGMSDWQEIGARIMIGRIYDGQDSIKAQLASTGIVRAFGIMDCEGNVDAERLIAELRREINKKGKMQLSVPGFGKFTFTVSDIDKLGKYITEG